jgi:hypothetical protein
MLERIFLMMVDMAAKGQNRAIYTSVFPISKIMRVIAAAF